MDAGKAYEVFKVAPKFKPVRLGSLSNLRMAIEIINRMAARMPGEYFIVDVATDEVVASFPEGSVTSENQPRETARTDDPDFDIFSGSSDKNALWIETVTGLSNARAHMEKLAAENPGPYFVFSSRDHTILAKVDTLAKPRLRPAKTKSDVA